MAGAFRSNTAVWRDRPPVHAYAHRMLYPAEVIVLARYRDRFGGRVLEPGCGAGRMLGYLLALGGQVHGFDIAPEMVAYSRDRYPEADVRLGDLADLDACVEGTFDVIFATYNVIDGFDHPTRLRILQDLRRHLNSDGLLVLSSHNLASLNGSPSAPAGEGAPGSRVRSALRWPLSRPLAELPDLVRRIPGRVRNRRRLSREQYRTADYAIVNDHIHDYALLHYFIGRDAQERQLAESGFELLECLDLSGAPVGPGESGEGAWLHYVARLAGRPAAGRDAVGVVGTAGEIRPEASSVRAADSIE